MLFIMNNKFVFWEDNGILLGFLEEFPDYMTLGETLEELKENLKDIYYELITSSIPSVPQATKLEI